MNDFLGPIIGLSLIALPALAAVFIARAAARTGAAWTGWLAAAVGMPLLLLLVTFFSRSLNDGVATFFLLFIVVPTLFLAITVLYWIAYKVFKSRHQRKAACIPNEDASQGLHPTSTTGVECD